MNSPKSVNTSALIGLLAVAAAGQSLGTFLAAKEAALADARDRATAAHVARCATLASDTCAVPGCGSEVFLQDTHGFECQSGFGPNGFSTKSTSAVRVPPNTNFLDAETRAFASSTGTLDALWREKLVSGAVNAWQYIGHTSGAIRKLPGVPAPRDTTTCQDYDARLRPWYAAAASGPKDVVLVLDTSGSMGRGGSGFGVSRIEALRRTVLALLRTMTPNDFVAVTEFNTRAKHVGFSRLQAATPDTIERLSVAVRSLQAGGETMISAGLNTGFKLLREREQSSRCTRVIMFLTDGESSEPDGLAKALGVARSGQEALEGNPAHIFTYSFGNSAGRDIERALACAHRGVWMPILDGQDPLVAMGQYYQLLASGIHNTKPRWTNPYEDAFGLGRMVSVALPVYDRSRSVALLTGVVSIDVTVSDLERFANFERAMAELTARSAECSPLSLSDCQLQYLREPTGYVCPDQPAVNSCAANGTFGLQPCVRIGNLNDYFCEPLDRHSLLSERRQLSVPSIVAQRCGDTASSPTPTTAPGGVGAPGAGSAPAPSGSSSSGAVAAGVSVAIMLMCLAVASLCFCRCMARRKQRMAASHAPDTYETQGPEWSSARV